MKKIYSLSLLLMVSVGAFAQNVPFSGTGLLSATANGWTTVSGTPDQLTIITTPSDSGNSLSKAGLAASTGNRTTIVSGNSEDMFYGLTTPITTTAYFSVLVKIADASTLAANTTTGDYSLTLASGNTAFQGRIYFKQGATANTFSVGVLNTSGGTAAPVYSTTDLAVNTTHLLVVKFVISTGVASLFVNPTPGAAEPTASATNSTGTTALPSQITGLVIRQGSNTGTMEIDEFRTGTTFTAVTPANLSVKQNDIAGLSIFPNPVTNGTLNINSDTNAERNVVLFDVLGKKVLNVTTSNNTINVGNLNAGVYIVKVTEEGKTATRKLVIR
jgi:hypothetical protein